MAVEMEIQPAATMIVIIMVFQRQMVSVQPNQSYMMASQPFHKLKVRCTHHQWFHHSVSLKYLFFLYFSNNSSSIRNRWTFVVIALKFNQSKRKFNDLSKRKTISPFDIIMEDFI